MLRLRFSLPGSGLGWLVAAAAVAGLPGSALAQSEPAGGEGRAQPEDLEVAPTMPDFPLWDYRVGADGLATTNADFDAGPGRVRRTVVGGGVGTSITLSRQLQIRIDGRGEWRQYDFSGATGFDPDGDPFDSLYRAYLNGLGFFRVSRRWQVAFGARISSQGEGGADLDDTLGGRVYARPIYQVNDKLTIGLGLVVQSRLEDDAIFAPAPMLTYQFNQEYSLHVQSLESVELRYDPSERFRLALEFHLDYNDFRLDDEGFAAGGVYRETAVGVGLNAMWRPTANLDLTGGIGSFVWQEIEILNSNGDELSQDNLLPSGYVSVGLQYRF